ncbi:MAG: hypothetical protein SFU25_05375, partial [Candidatus Caenarcaniphilales bacterium]|nr:hypothetical protein [Candidatus Caenarcaniphilales bacterium]
MSISVKAFKGLRNTTIAALATTMFGCSEGSFNRSAITDTQPNDPYASLGCSSSAYTTPLIRRSYNAINNDLVQLWKRYDDIFQQLDKDSRPYHIFGDISKETKFYGNPNDIRSFLRLIAPNIYSNSSIIRALFERKNLKIYIDTEVRTISDGLIPYAANNFDRGGNVLIIHLGNLQRKDPIYVEMVILDELMDQVAFLEPYEGLSEEGKLQFITKQDRVRYIINQILFLHVYHENRQILDSG